MDAHFTVTGSSSVEARVIGVLRQVGVGDCASAVEPEEKTGLVAAKVSSVSEIVCAVALVSRKVLSTVQSPRVAGEGRVEVSLNTKG